MCIFVILMQINGNENIEESGFVLACNYVQILNELLHISQVEGVSTIVERGQTLCK